jgi:hypothetical protein
VLTAGFDLLCSVSLFVLGMAHGQPLGLPHWHLSHWPLVPQGAGMLTAWLPVPGVDAVCLQTWDYQHIVAHHIYTNEWPYDTDSAFPLKSILYNQRRLFFHKYQVCVPHADHSAFWLQCCCSIRMLRADSSDLAMSVFLVA